MRCAVTTTIKLVCSEDFSSHENQRTKVLTTNQIAVILPEMMSLTEEYLFSDLSRGDANSL
jgi:hypothetical protein